MECKKADGTAQKKRINYLFKGFYNDKDKLVGGLRPLPNITFAAETIVPEDPKDFKNGCTIKQIMPWCSNYLGAINMLLANFKDGHRARILTAGIKAKEQKLYFPSPEDLSYIYAAKGEQWQKILREGFDEVKKEGLKSEKSVDFTRQKVLFSELEKPFTDSQLAGQFNISEAEITTQIKIAKQLIDSNMASIDPKSIHEDIIYRAWYDKQNKSDFFHGYIIKQSRFVVFTFSNPQAKFWEISFWPHGENKGPDHNKIEIHNHTDNLSAAVFRNNKNTLISQLYNIEIKSLHEDFSENWGNKYKKNNSYTLVEKFRFEIKNLAGEFEVVNCDPLTVEEGLFKQHNTQFLHLLNAAKTDPEKKTPPKEAVSGTTDPALNSIAHDIKTVKTKMDFMRGVLDVDGQRKVMKSLGEAVSNVLETANVDDKIIDSIDLAFNINDYQYKTFVDLKNTYKTLNSEVDLASDSLQDIMRNSDKIIKKIWKGSATPADETLADWLVSKYNLPEAHVKRTLKRFDFISNKMATSLDIYDTVQIAHKYFYEDINKLEKKQLQHHDVFMDYHKQISVWDDKKTQLGNSTFKPNEKGELSLTINFDFDKTNVEDKAITVERTSMISRSEDSEEKEYIQEVKRLSESAAINELVDLMREHPEVEIELQGHTDPVGKEQYNLDLSQRRAAAVKKYLTAAFSIDEARIMVTGLGENNLIYNEQGEPDHAASRRVAAVVKYIGTYHYQPSREGISSLEQARHATVMSKQGHDEDLAALSAKAWDWILATGAAHPYVRLLSAITVTYGLVKNGLALLDDVMFDHFFQQEIAQYQQLKSYHSSSNVNQILLRQTFEAEKNDANMLYLQTQFRVRSEAINGLIGLLTRAAIGASDEEDYIARFKKYQIAAYIENFLLNDKWLFPLRNIFPLTMDEYWTYAINSAGLISEESYSWFGFDKDFHLRNTPDKKTLSFLENIALLVYQKDVKEVDIADALVNYKNTAAHVYSLASSTTAKHERADFQSCFPIHHLSSDKFDHFAKNFATNFDFLDDDIYQHTAIYARGQKSKDKNDWQLLSDWRIRDGVEQALSPLDQIRILVILKEDKVNKQGVYPASIQLIRTDWYNIDGPVYKTLLRPLVASELLSSEQQYKGRVGCVVHPIYQFGRLTFCGTKPMATDTRLDWHDLPFSLPDKFRDSEGFEQGWDYWRLGGLTDMTYEFVVRIGDNGNSKHTIRVAGPEDDADGEYDVTVQVRTALPSNRTFHKTRRGRRTRYKDKYNWHDDALFLYGPFLKSRSRDAVYPVLFDEDSTYLMVMIRIGGENSVYLCPSDLFEDEMNKAFNQTLKMHLSVDATLNIDNFDWHTSVEFMFIASTSKVDFDAYQSVNMSWQRLSFSTRMVETTGVNTFGPKINTSMSYLGQLKKQGGMFSAKYKFETDDYSSTREKFKPIVELLKKPGDKANLMGGTYADVFTDDKRYIYAAYYRCQYENLVGSQIDSMRPFGEHRSLYQDRILLNKGTKTSGNRRISKNFRPSFKYAFTQVKTGDKSIEQDWIKHLNTFTTDFHFKAPRSYYKNVPWVDEPENSEQLIKEARLYNKETLLSQWQLKSEEDKKKDIKYWIEKDTQSIRQIGVNAIRK